MTTTPIQKLFVQCEGNYPDCYEGSSLCECLGQLLIVCDDDNQLDSMIADISTFLLGFDESDGKHWKTFISNSMMDCVTMAFGFASWEEFEDNDLKRCEHTGLTRGELVGLCGGVSGQCSNCECQIFFDDQNNCWVDNSGGDVCGVDGTNSPHQDNLGINNDTEGAGQ